MQNSKLIILLKSLKPEEIRWLTKFVHSPFYNSNVYVIALFNILKPTYPDFDTKTINKEKIWQKLFPQKKMESGRLRLIMHNLAGLVEEFMVANRLKKQSSLFRSLLNTELGERDMYDFFEKETFRQLQELEASPYRDNQYFKEKKELLMQWYGHPGTNRQKQTDIIKELSENQKIHHALEELQLIFAHNARAIVSSELAIKKLPKHTISIAETSNNALIKIYVLLANLQQGAENLDKIINIFSTHLATLRREEKRTIIQILINHSARLYNSGKSKTPQKLLNLYKLGLENDCVLVNDEITEATFQNIIVVGALCEDWDWTNKFIKNYQAKLPNLSREAATAMGQGLLHFYKKEYDRSIEILLDCKFSKLQQEIQSKLILIRCYFEKFVIDNSYYELLFFQIKAFEKYIRRKEAIPTQKIEELLNFTKFLKRIIEKRNKLEALSGLQNQIMTAKNVTLKNWLLEKTGAKHTNV